MGPADRHHHRARRIRYPAETIIRNISPAKVKYFTRQGDANPSCQMVGAPKFAKIPRELCRRLKTDVAASINKLNLTKYAEASLCAN